MTAVRSWCTAPARTPTPRSPPRRQRRCGPPRSPRSSRPTSGPRARTRGRPVQMTSRPLSPPEIRAWISSNISPHPAEQNMVQGYRLRGAVDVDTLCRNTAALLVNHPTLRTAYTLGPDGDLTATVLDPPAAPPVRVLNAGTGGEEQAAALVATQAAEEFDLAEPPLA